MFPESPISFREFAMAETLPLAAVQGAVLEFLRCRDDAAIFGAQAVNAYVGIARMTQDVDILSTTGEVFANTLCKHLHEKIRPVRFK